MTYPESARAFNMKTSIYFLATLAHSVANLIKTTVSAEGGTTLGSISPQIFENFKIVKIKNHIKY
jgi:hypothetical protein